MLRLVAAWVLVVAALAPTAQAARNGMSLRGCVVQGITARCGTLLVQENRPRPDGRRIGLHVVVIPARVHPARPDAFTYLAGGPGTAAASAMTASVMSIWPGVHEHHDIVLVDQRGTGASNPLECPLPRGPLASGAERRAYIRACLASLDADVTQYGTRAAMDDLDAVRSALGYRTLDVYGTSYGATAAQVYLERHPRSVRTVILDGGTLLDIPFYSRFAVNGERALADVARRCAAERACARAVPRWRAQLAALVRSWNLHPVRLRPSGSLSGDGLAGVVQQMSVTSDAASAIPLVVSRAASGHPELLSAYVVAGGLTRSIMFWSIWCNEPWVGLDARGPWHTYLDGSTTAALVLYRAVCALFPRRVENPSDWKRPGSRVPLLALVGGADPQDPVENLAGLRRAMPSSRIIVVPGQGHAIGQYGCLGELVARFIDRGSAQVLDTRCARDVRPPAFALG